MSQANIAAKNGELTLRKPQNMLVAVGSNMNSVAGNPTETVLAAVESVQRAGGVIRARSRLYRTPAFPAGSGPDYVNAALAVAARWTDQEALAQLHDIEKQLGRSRKARWEQRAIDLDLLARDQTVLPDLETMREWMDLPLEQQKRAIPDQMILPHPRMHERAFVLVPLADVAPDWEHPVLKRTVREMLAALPASDLDQIKPLE